MFRFTIFLAFAFIAFCSASAVETKSLGSIEVVSDIKKFRAENPNVVLTELNKLELKDYSIRYTLGSHASGESLVASTSNSYSWGTPQDIELTLTYPTSGTGKVVTYVEINVVQTTNQGRAYVVSGGIGQRSIKIIVEALKVTYFKYNASIYGY